jgi:hypothetical protein
MLSLADVRRHNKRQATTQPPIGGGRALDRIETATLNRRFIKPFDPNPPPLPAVFL